MSLWRSIRSGLRSLVRRREVERELEEELQHFLELQTQENLRGGMSGSAAARAARVHVGGIEATTARVRSGGWEAIVETTWQDVRHAFRGLHRNRGFTLLAASTLALGIGANTAMYSVVNAVILRPLPYESSDRLGLIWTDDARRGLHQEETAYLTIQDWRERSHAFSSIAFFHTGRLTRINEVNGERSRSIGALVSGNLFSVLGVAPLHGRVISDDDEASRAQVAVISHALWQSAYGGAPDIIGRRIRVDDGGKGGLATLTVIGVMPAGFYFPNKQTEIYSPATTYWRFTTESTERFQDWARRWTGIGRLAPGVSLSDARDDMARIGQQLSAAHVTSVPDFPGFATTVMPVLDSIAGSSLQSALWLLLAAVGMVLLVACANVANLLYARGAARQQEFAVRNSLGAGRGRLIRQLTVESLVLALVGGTLGVLIALWGTRALSRMAASYVPRLEENTLDARVLLFALAISLAAGFIFGVLPAIRLSSIAANEALREGGRGTGSHGLSRKRASLIVTECALAILLLTGAGLLLRSLHRLQSIDPGFDPQNVLIARLEFPSDPPVTAEERARRVAPGPARALVREQQVAQLTDQLNALPGVAAAGFIDDLFVHGAANEAITIPGRGDAVVNATQLNEGSVTPGFFEAMRVPLRRGRYLTRADIEQAIRTFWSPIIKDLPLAEKQRRALAEPVVVNDAFVHRFFPTEDPIGKRFCIDPTGKTYWFEIVGVIGDMHRQGLERTAVPEFISAYFPRPSGRADLLVRTESDPATLTTAIRTLIKREIPGADIAFVSSVETQLGDFSAQRRLQTGLLSGFAALAMVLAVIGIFGLVHYSIGERTREIGVRIALGARPQDVLSMVVRQGMRMPAIGITIGLIASALLTRVMSHLLFQIGAMDPVTFLAVAFVLLFFALVACYLAARRAILLDPLKALRQ
jgi:putative ABC transport system permease protein